MQNGGVPNNRTKGNVKSSVDERVMSCCKSSVDVLVYLSYAEKMHEVGAPLRGAVYDIGKPDKNKGWNTSPPRDLVW